MRKRVLFRTLVILLASTLLLTSTGAYNILAFADQNMDSVSLSATNEGAASAPSISTFGGALIVEKGYAAVYGEPEIGEPETDEAETDASDEAAEATEAETDESEGDLAANGEIDELEIGTQSGSDPFDGSGTASDPYQITNSNFLQVYDKINNSETNKYFQLVEDINISSLPLSSFHDSAQHSALYLFSAEGSNPSSAYFVIDGAYEEGGVTKRHSIYANANSLIDASAYQYFAIFGFMNENCEVKNLIIDNVHVNTQNARAVSIVAFKNMGQSNETGRGGIQNVSVTNCSISVTGSSANIDANVSSQSPFSYLDDISNTGYDVYPGFAAVTADNRGKVENATVENFSISVNNGSHYLAGVVAQNRGSAQSGCKNCTVNGLNISATAANAYVGGVCAFNDSYHMVTGAVVDLPGHGTANGSPVTYGGRIYGGRYVGGLVGLNDGAVSDSLIEGSFSTISTPDSQSYDMFGLVSADNSTNAVSYYYGGAVAGGSGTITDVTVQNLGFYMSLVSTDQPCYFGGITATASAAGAVTDCVSTGSFASSAHSAVCHAGGVIGYAPANAAAGTLSNCYTLFRIQNKAHYLNGAVIGFGGTSATASNCYWSSEISGCVTAYAIPVSNADSTIEQISDRSFDLTATDSNGDPMRAVVSRRNQMLSGIAKPSHSWSGSNIATITGTGTLDSHTVQGVVNSLDSVPYQQTLTLPGGIGYSGRTSFAVDFKLDVFITASDNIGNPNDPDDPLQISTSGMIRFLYLAPYANYVLTQNVTIDETEWEPVAFYGRLSGVSNNSPVHTIYAPCRVFSAVVGQRAAGVTINTVTAVDDKDTSDTADDVEITQYSTTPGSVTVDGGLIEQLNVTLTPDYFVLNSGAVNQSVFGSLFGATMRFALLTNDTDQSAMLSGSRQGVFADAAYRNTYLYGCSTDVSFECADDCTDVGAFLGYLDASGNVVDNCMVDADGANPDENETSSVAAFIGNITANTGKVMNSIVVTTVADGVASIFGAAGSGPSAAAGSFDNIFWARNSSSETSAPIGDGRTAFGGLTLWGTTNDQELGQFYNLEHTLNSGDAIATLPLPQNMAKLAVTTAAEAETEFTITRLTPNGVQFYDDPEISVVNKSAFNQLVLSFTAKDSTQDGSIDTFKITHTKTGLCAYIVITAQAAGALQQDADGFYMVRSAADLKNISTEIANGDDTVAGYPYKLYANIDMSYFDGSDTNRQFFAIGTTSHPFWGAFVGGEDPETHEPYTISNVTVLDANNKDTINHNNGFFGVVDATSPVEVDGTIYGIEDLYFENLRVIGGDHVGSLAGSVKSAPMAYGEVNKFPIRNIHVSDSVVTGGNTTGTTDMGKRVGGLIGEVADISLNLSNVTLNNVEVTTYFFDAAFSNQVMTTVDGSDRGYFSSDYFAEPMGLGGVIGAAFSGQGIDFPTEITITDTHVSNLYVAGRSRTDENEATYATMDAGGIIGSVLNSYNGSYLEQGVTTLTIGDSETSSDVTVTNSKIMAFGNTGGIIGASDVATILTNCVVSGSDASAAPERSAMQVLSRSLFYVGGIVGYSGISTYNTADGYSFMSTNVIYASLTDCSVVNAYVASTDTSYMGQGAAPVRNVAVGGIIGGGNGQGYCNSADDSESENDDLYPYVSGCTVNHSRVEGVITGGVVGADAEIRYVSDYAIDDTPDWYLLNMRDLITNCSVTNTKVTTLANATRVAGDCPSASGEAYPVGSDHFVLASGVGGIMGTNVRFHYDSLRPDYNKGYNNTLRNYAFMHDTIIQYCDVAAGTTVENRLPYTEATTMATAAVGGVLGNAFTNQTQNGYYEPGRCVLRYNEVGASVYNAANLSDQQDFNQDIYTETEVKVGTGGFIGAVKGGTNYSVASSANNMYNAICDITGIHVYTSVFSGSLSGTRGIGGAIGVVNFATDADLAQYSGRDWTMTYGSVPGQMLFNLALAGSISLTGSEESYSNETCCGGYVIGHISAGTTEAYTFIDGVSSYFSDPSYVFSDITYTSFGCDAYLVPFGFLNGNADGNPANAVYPRIDGVLAGTGCFRDVNLDENGDVLFRDKTQQYINRYNDLYAIDITEGSGDSFVIMAADTAIYNWRGSDDSVAQVTTVVGSTAKQVIVHGLRSGTVQVSIPFVGYLNDGTGVGRWGGEDNGYGIEVFIPCGFSYESPTQARLTIAKERDGSNGAFTGVEYRLIETPYDLGIIGYDISAQINGVNSNKSLSASAMSAKYALYNTEGVIEFTDDMFAANGSFPGGLTPVGSSSYMFTGSFETLPEGYYDFVRSSVSYQNSANGSLVESTDTNVHVAYDHQMILRNVRVKSSGSVGASLFGLVSGASFRHFDIDGMTLAGSTSGNYLGAIACKAFAPDTAGTAPITIDNVNLNNFTFSEADYIGGLVGGIFANQTNSAANTAASVISNCVVGAPDAESIRAEYYDNSIEATTGAGGLLAHSSQYATNITNCVVRDVEIVQQADSSLFIDSANLDSGAAGVVMAYAGTMNNVTVEHCAITGEIVGGAVMRSYTSQLEDDFASAGTFANYQYTTSRIICPSADSVTLTGINIKNSALEGTIDVDSGSPYSASGGILARVDASTASHTITDCLVDDKTTIKAVDGVGGIVGCLENPYGNEVTVNVAHAEHGVTVTDCTMNADLSRTVLTEAETVFNRGIGGIIGVFYRFSPLTYTRVSGCVVGGTIHAETTAGGVIGSILADRTNDIGFEDSHIAPFLDFKNTTGTNKHFVSNCLVTAKFVTRAAGTTTDIPTFSSRRRGVGVVLGYYVMNNNGVSYVMPATANYYASAHTEPFYHVMFSSANYSEGYVSLFGFDNASGSHPCLNSNANVTTYLYDLNRTGLDHDNNESSHFMVSTEGYLALPDESGKVTRINSEAPNAAGLTEVYSTSFNRTNANTLTFDWSANASDINKLVFDTDTTGEDYSFNNGALPDAFTTSSNNGAAEKEHDFALASVSLANGTNYFDVKYPATSKDSTTGSTVTNPQAFSLTLKQGVELNDKLTLTLLFTYENGLTMSMDLFINVRPREYWRLDPDDSGLDYTYYLVFNASDLAALQKELSCECTGNNGDTSNARADARVIQCYDVFWTLSDASVVSAARTALDDNGYQPTIAEVLGNAYTGPIDTGESSNEFILSQYLGSFKRPNPDYLEDPINNPDPEISFYDYYGDTGNVPMIDIVGDIGAIDYGVYGEPGSAAIINPYTINNSDRTYVPFTGRYITLQNSLSDSTGATEHGENYAIYGLEFRAENIVANTGTDAPYAGLIAQLGGGAVVDGARFINPKISVINSYETACSAGVLAGAVSYTDDDLQNGLDAPVIRNVSILDSGDGVSFVKAIKRMNRASSSAGGLVGEINGTATVYNVTVSGVDIVSSYTANAQGVAEETSILVGGIAGKVVGTDGVGPAAFYGIDVTGCHVLGGHIANPVGNIKSYGGGLFGIMNASVDMLSTDPITGEERYNLDSEELPFVQSEVSGTTVGGSYISSSYGYDRDDLNNTALDIAGGVAAVSQGECTVTYVNVIASQVVAGDIAGGIVGQIANKGLQDSDIVSLTVTKSGVGLQKGYIDGDDTGTEIIENTDPTDVQILVVGTAGTSNRFNTAGGVVGVVQNLDNLYIGTVDYEQGVDVNGVIGAYGYDNHNREATAGGLIGSISGSDESGFDAELDSYLDKIQIYGSNVQGEVNGFNREYVTNMKCAGSAGGLIGKIACAARKDINNVGDGNLFIKDCIMSAKVNLYTSVYGVTVDCADTPNNRSRNTNVGKLIGRMADGALIDDDCDPIDVAEDLWPVIYSAIYADTAELSDGNSRPITDDNEALMVALRGDLWVNPFLSGNTYLLNDHYIAVNDYIQKVYGSSYPQDIVLYGNRVLCGIDFEIYADMQTIFLELPYYDCNQNYRYLADTEVAADTFGADYETLPMKMQSFMVSEGEPNSGDPEADAAIFTSNAFIQYQDSAVSVDKYFRFMNPNDKLVFQNDQVDILDSNGVKISEATTTYNDGFMSEQVDLYDLSSGDQISSLFYPYYYGEMTINLPNVGEMVGGIVLNFAYGIQMNSSFTSIQINGDGTPEHPYEIAAPKHFYVMRALHTNGKYFKQVKNIDLNVGLNDPSQSVLNRYTTLEGFDPIGTPASPFYGHFDGDGYVISNLYINDEATNAVGLFGCVGMSSELKNIHIEVADKIIIRDLDDQRTMVNGGILGGNNTGGLVGSIKATGNSNTTVTNCSVANGNVVGGMNVGALIGSSAGAVTVNNCFTSATTASYAGVANVGALLGAAVSGTPTLNDCFTAGFAVAGSETAGTAAVGGLVGRNNSGSTLTLNRCFISATASGNTANAVGLTVGANGGSISATGNTVAALIAPDVKGKTLANIAPGVNGSSNYYESKMLGVIEDGAAAIAYTDNAAYEAMTTYAASIAQYDSGSDAYSEAYRNLIATAVKVDQSVRTVGSNQIQSENIQGNGGLIYPLTMSFSNATAFTTSVYDLSDTVAYPMGIDLGLTGNGSNKNTDLLFRTTSDGSTSSVIIYRNIFRNNEQSVAVKHDGETYPNGEIYYDYSLPYAVATQTIPAKIGQGESASATTLSIARKIMYPVMDINDYGIGHSYVFPIATARQLKALTSTAEHEPGTKFSFLRDDSSISGRLDYQTRDLLLVADIDLASTVFTPMETLYEHFYGNGHVISNLQIQSSGNAAMFTSVQSGSVFDLGLMGVNVVNRDNAQTAKAAMLAGDISGATISNCFAIGSVSATAVTSGIAVGGLVASAANDSTIENCIVSGNVTGGAGTGSEVAGLLGKSTGTVTIDNVTVTANVSAYNTYAICGTSVAAAITNAVYGGQMANNADGQGVAGRQHLYGTGAAVAKTGNGADDPFTLWVDKDLGLLITNDNLKATTELADPAFVSAAHFYNGGMASFGNGFYPVAETFDIGTSDAFKAGVRFAAAAIQLNHVGSGDTISSLSAPGELGTYGSARLSAMGDLGIYVDSEGGTTGGAVDRVSFDTTSMRLTRQVTGGYAAAAAVTGTVSYSMILPMANNYLVRTVSNVKLQKAFKLCYEFVNASGQNVLGEGDRSIITVKNVVDNGDLITTGLTQITGSGQNLVTSGQICGNVIIAPNGNVYSLDGYCQPGSGDKVSSVTIRPAYLDGNNKVVSNVTVTPSGATSSFNVTSAIVDAGGSMISIGAAEHVNHIQYDYLLVTVEMTAPDWGLQRTGGNWIFDTVSQGS